MTDKITLELTLQELELINKNLLVNVDTKPILEKTKNAYPKPKMIVENQGDFEIVSYNNSIYYYLHYPTGSHWFLKNDVNLELVTDKETIQLLNDAWFKDYNEVVELAKPAEEVLDRLEDKYAKYGGFSYFTDDIIDSVIEKWKEDPPTFLRFEMSNTLEKLITDWWCDTFTSKSGLSMEESIADLCEKVREWLPVEQNADGSQDTYAIVAVDTHNELLRKIKSKLRNKK